MARKVKAKNVKIKDPNKLVTRVFTRHDDELMFIGLGIAIEWSSAAKDPRYDKLCEDLASLTQRLRLQGIQPVNPQTKEAFHPQTKEAFPYATSEEMAARETAVPKEYLKVNGAIDARPEGTSRSRSRTDGSGKYAKD